MSKFLCLAIYLRYYYEMKEKSVLAPVKRIVDVFTHEVSTVSCNHVYSCEGCVKFMKKMTLCRGEGSGPYKMFS